MADKDKKSLGEVDDVLDQIKEIERAVKAQTLIKILSSLKQYAREILELKEKTTASLEELGISEADIKRVIDFINNSPEVQLTENDKKKLREEVKQSVASKKKNSQEEFEKKLSGVFGTVLANPFIGYSQVVSPGANGYNFQYTGGQANGISHRAGGLADFSATSGSLALSANALNTSNLATLTVSSHNGDELEISL